MTIKLLKKEFALASNPMVWLFLALAGMIFIPSYPYYVSALYYCLAVFFVCMLGRGSNDVEFTLMLPISKADVVKARYLFVAAIEGIFMLTLAVAVILRNLLTDYDNIAGIEANVAFLGLTLVMFAGFNAIYLGTYYKNVDKVGRGMIGGSIWVVLFIFFAEALTYIEPTKSYLDASDAAAQIGQIPVLLGGIAVYALVMFISCKKSQRKFEKLDF